MSVIARLGRVGLLLSLFISVTACLNTPGRLPLELLPEQPIAFIHWADKDGQRRSEIFSKIGEAPPIPTDSENPERLEEMKIRAYLRGDEILQVRQKLEEYPGRLMLLWPRTGEMERVEAAPIDAIPLDWSPDRRRLLLASAHRGGKEQLYEYHPARKELVPVTRGPFEHARGTYDAEGNLYVQRIHRLRREGASTNTVHRVERGGTLSAPLATGVPPGTVRVLPGGDRIVYEQIVPRPRRNGPTVYESFIAIQTLGGENDEKLLLKGREPIMTEDGQWIVFASPSTAGYRLRRMRTDGTSRVPIGPGGNEERMPTVSPGGEYVVFTELEYGRRRLAVRRYDGKDERVLLASGWSEFPVW